MPFDLDRWMRVVLSATRRHEGFIVFVVPTCQMLVVGSLSIGPAHNEMIDDVLQNASPSARRNLRLRRLSWHLRSFYYILTKFICNHPLRVQLGLCGD